MKIELCTLCDECGFTKGAKKGVLKIELGLMEIIRNQVIFPCHKVLKAHTGSENTGTREYAEKTGKVQVCSGYVQSLKKSGILPNNEAMSYLYEQTPRDNSNIMTIEETLKHHFDMGDKDGTKK